MPSLWIRIAVALYGAGLVCALAYLHTRSERWWTFVLPAVRLGAILHLVSLVELLAGAHHWMPVSVHEMESLLGLLLMGLFLLVHRRYRTSAPGLFVIPIVFALCLAAALGPNPQQLASPLWRGGWVFVHIVLILTGYSALLFSLFSSILYLLQERHLKRKSVDGLLARLPSLETADQIGYRTLLLGFPFMTLGLATGALIAESSVGVVYFRDPKVLLSIAMWVLYVGLIYVRWSAGVRGRRAVWFSGLAFLVVLTVWAANSFSTMHRFLAP